MKKTVVIVVIAVAALILLLIVNPFYTLNEGEFSIVLRFGQIVASSDQAGLKLKTPFTDSVVVFPKKILAWDGEPRQIQTKENQLIWVDTTARWRIADVKKFYAAVRSLESAYGKLDSVVDNAVRTVVSKNSLTEAVRSTNDIEKSSAVEVFQTGDESSDAALQKLTQNEAIFDPISKGRKKLSIEMVEIARPIAASEYGIEIIDVVIREIAYTEDQIDKIYERMTKERSQIAQAYRSFGEGKKAEWLGRQQKEQKTIMSEAVKKSEIIKGEADAKASRIYADAYSRDPEFFSFWRAIESYKETLGGFDKTMSTDMDYFRYLYSPRGR
jgi:membrane protease subunit HflC